VHVRGRAGHVVHARQGKDLRRLVTATPGPLSSSSIRPSMEIDPRDETNEIEPYTTHHQYITHTQPSFIASKLFLAISSEQNACNVLQARKLLSLHFRVTTTCGQASMAESESPVLLPDVAWRDLVTMCCRTTH
jgi:hypothetical protein